MKKAKVKNYGTVEASKLTGVHYTTIKNYVKKGKIDGFVNEINGRSMVTEKGIEQLNESFRKK